MPILLKKGLPMKNISINNLRVKHIVSIISLIFFLFLAGGSAEDSSSKSSSKSGSSSLSGSSVLVGYDWVYPDMNDPIGAWKFSSDGSFNYSTTMFGGNTRRGRWEDGSNNKIELYYTDGKTNKLEIISKSRFRVGSTIYKKY